MATDSSVLAWRIPDMGEPGWLLSMGSHRVGHDWSDLAVAAAAAAEWKQWPEENVEKFVWKNEISRSSGGRSGREHTNCGLWCKRSKFLQSCPTLCDPIGVGCHFLLQGIFSPRDQIWVSRIAGRVLIIFWATRDYSTEVQNDDGIKMQGLQEGRVGRMQVSSYIHHSLCVTLPSCPHSFPPSLPLSCCGSHFWALWKC